MGANYDTILIPTVKRETIIKVLVDALGRLGQQIVHHEEPQVYGRFHSPSTRMIFVAPSGNSCWLPISADGCGLRHLLDSVGDWYLKNPLAISLSYDLSPVLYYFSFDSGAAAGYSIFADGKQVEEQVVGGHLALGLEKSSPRPSPPHPTMLGKLLKDWEFDYTTFVSAFQKRGHPGLEIATAALAARLDVTPHLLDPHDIDDGDGGIVVDEAQYRTVSLDGWMAVYY